MKIRSEFKTWAKYLREAIPGEARVTRYRDEDESHAVDILTSKNDEGVAATTIGVMDHDQSRNPRIEVFTEILLDARGDGRCIGNIASMIAFYIMKDGWKVAPGVVFEQMVEMHVPDLGVKHVLFVPPYQWGPEMSEVDLGTKTIHPLLAVPIAESERVFAEEHGCEALESLWAEHDCDVLNWARDAVV